MTTRIPQPATRKGRMLVLVGALAASLVLGASAAAALRTPPPVSEMVAGEALLVDAAAPRPTGALGDAEAVRTCSIDASVADPAALNFSGLIVDADTGEVRFARDEQVTHPTASVMKLVTAATAMTVLGPETRLTTSVYPGDREGSVVLVGAGDATLRSQDASYYASLNPASLADLAAGVSATSVGFDSSLYSGPTWQPSWADSDRTDGYISAITPLMVDAGRADPVPLYSPRSAQPDVDAATKYAAMLGASVDASVRVKPGSEPLVSVQSPTVRELVARMLLDSDNVIAEQLARLSAIKLGAGSDFSAIDAAQHQMFASLGLDAQTFQGVDGSGMSRDNRASAALIAGLLERYDSDAALEGLNEDLPESATTGTLDERLAGIPAGVVTAKTGWIEEVFGLAGFVHLDDGTRLRFAMFVTAPDGVVTTRTNRNAIDAIITAVYGCGAQLSDV